MTKNVEIKWVKTRGNENLSIIPLSFLSDMRRPMWVADRGVRVLDDSNGSGSSLERQRVNHRKLDKRVRSLERNLPATSTAFPLHLPQMSNPCTNAGVTVFGPNIRGNPPRAVYQRSSRKITHSITTNPSHLPADLTLPYLSPKQVRLWT